MDIKRLLIGTIIGAIVLQVVGYLIFAVALADFFAANTGMSGVFKAPALQWALAIGNLGWAALITLCLANRTQTIASGLTTGAVIGFLVWFNADWNLYGVTNLFNLTITMIDPPLSAIESAFAGAAIAAVLARVPNSAGLQAAE